MIIKNVASSIQTSYLIYFTSELYMRHRQIVNIFTFKIIHAKLKIEKLQNSSFAWNFLPVLHKFHSISYIKNSSQILRTVFKLYTRIRFDIDLRFALIFLSTEETLRHVVRLYNLQSLLPEHLRVPRYRVRNTKTCCTTGVRYKQCCAFVILCNLYRQHTSNAPLYYLLT